MMKEQREDMGTNNKTKKLRNILMGNLNKKR